MSFLSSKWTQKASPKSERACVELRRSQRTYFEVVDPQLSKKIKDWHTRYYDTERHITQYLRTVSSVLGGETPHYKIDDDGKVEAINFRYAMGLLHDGWTGFENTNWLVPDSGKVKKEIEQLPRMPSHKDVNKAIGWPVLKYYPMSLDAHIPGFKTFVTRSNRQTNVSVSEGRVFLSVPGADSFDDCPPFAEEVKAWQPPESLQEIDARKGARIEKTSRFSRSPLGGIVAKALHKGASFFPNQS